jgi:hypothetical protein
MYGRRLEHVVFLLLVFCLLFGSTQQIQAEESGNEKTPYVMEQITVTAEKIEEKAQDVPASVTVYTEDQITNYGVDDTEMLFQKTPNIHMVKSGPKASPEILGPCAAFHSCTAHLHHLDSMLTMSITQILTSVCSMLNASKFSKDRRGHSMAGMPIRSGQYRNEKKTTTSGPPPSKAGTGTYGFRDVSATLGGPIISDTLAFRFFRTLLRFGRFFYNTAKDQRNADRSDDLTAVLRCI